MLCCSDILFNNWVEEHNGMTVRKKEACSVSKQSYATVIKYMSFSLLLYCVVKTGILCLVVENWRRQEKIGVVNRTL